MVTINHKDGNIFSSSAQIICHQTNCIGLMGSGIAAEVKRRYPNVYTDYRNAYKNNELVLGAVIFSETGNKKHQIIANLCGQQNVSGTGQQMTDYNAVRECLETVLRYATENHARTEKLQKYAEECGNRKITVAFPYGMSSVRGGGKWERIYSMIEDVFREADLDIEIWKLK